MTHTWKYYHDEGNTSVRKVKAKGKVFKAVVEHNGTDYSWDVWVFLANPEDFEDPLYGRNITKGRAPTGQEAQDEADGALETILGV